MREPAEDVTLPLFIADDVGALQVAADVLLQRQGQVAVGHKLGHSLYLPYTNTLSMPVHLIHSLASALRRLASMQPLAQGFKRCKSNIEYMFSWGVY